MLGRTTLVIAVAALVLIASPGRVEAQVPGSSDHVEHLLTARVPLVARMVTVQGADGTPIVRLETNDPALRAAYAGGATPESVAVPFVSGTSPAGGQVESTGQLLRYTLAAP